MRVAQNWRYSAQGSPAYSIQEWHQKALKARANPNDPESMPVLRAAAEAIHAYATGPLHTNAVAGDVQSYQGMDPGPLAADASHALNSATLGLANSIGGPKWQAFQQLGDEFQPSASARGDIAGSVVPANGLAELGVRAGGPVAGRVLRAIPPGFAGNATTQAVVNSAVGGGLAVGIPSGIAGFLETDGSLGDKLSQGGRSFVGGGILGAGTAGLGGVAARAIDQQAAGRLARMARSASAQAVAARQPLQDELVQARTALANARMSAIPSVQQAAEVRLQAAKQRLLDMGQKDMGPIQGQELAVAPEPAQQTVLERQMRSRLLRFGTEPDRVEAMVAQAKAQPGHPLYTGPAVADGTAVAQPIQPPPSATPSSNVAPTTAPVTPTNTPASPTNRVTFKYGYNPATGGTIERAGTVTTLHDDGIHALVHFDDGTNDLVDAGRLFRPDGSPFRSAPTAHAATTQAEAAALPGDMRPEGSLVRGRVGLQNGAAASTEIPEATRNFAKLLRQPPAQMRQVLMGLSPDELAAVHAQARNAVRYGWMTKAQESMMAQLLGPLH